MKRNIFHLLLLFCLLGSCMKDNLPTQNTSGEVTLGYTFQDIQTMAVATQGETTLNDVYLMFYNNDDDTYATHQWAQVLGSGGSLSFPIPDVIQVGKSYKVLVVGNYDRYKAGGKSFDQYIEENSSKSYSKMKEDIYSQTPNQERITTPLPYCGTLVGADGEQALFTISEKGELPSNVSVKFNRVVCRIDVVNKVANKLNIKWVKVCNYRDQGYFFRTNAPKGQNVVKGISATPPTEGSYPLGYVHSPAPVSGRQDIRGGLYAYPNIVAFVTQSDAVSTYVMVAGYFQKAGEPENTTKLTYYRANVAVNGENQLLIPNTAYTIIINDVLREGGLGEEQASGEKSSSLDYTVGDQWQDGSNNSTSDGQGNFLTVNTKEVVLDSNAGVSKEVYVSVKSTATWNLAWVTPDSPFDFRVINATSFSITSKSSNSSSSLNQAVLKITVPGTSLSMEINVSQLSSADDVKILMVDGHTTDYTIEIPGHGANVRLQVLTGSASAKWTVSKGADNYSMIQDINIGGSHQEYITLTTGFNFYNFECTAKVIVIRNPSDQIPNLTITLKQKKADYLVALSPNINQIKIEGFSSDLGYRNGLVGGKGEKFTVKLADPTNYTCKVELKGEYNFNKDADAYLSINQQWSQLPATYSSVREQTKTVIEGLKDNQSFYLNTFRTGPGDPDIKLSLIITAVPNNPLGKSTNLTIPITITTNCSIGDVELGNGKMIADRNYGADPKSSWSIALNYTVSTIGNPPSNQNSMYRGNLVRIFQTSADQMELELLCQAHGKKNYSGEMSRNWRLPTNADFDYMSSFLCYSKERVFLVTRREDGDSSIGCYFPLSGTDDTSLPDQTAGYYWTSDFELLSDENTTHRYAMKFTKNMGNYFLSKSPGSYTLRCVRDDN